jgi:hypothetical protein
VLGYFYLHGGQVKDLPALMSFDGNVFKGTLAVLAALDPMNLQMIRIGSHFQGMPLVAGLSPAFLAARLSEAAITGLLEPITGRWFAAVATVFGQLIFQRLHSLFETLNSFLLLLENPDPVAYQAHDKGNHGIFALASSGSNFFFSRQAGWFHRLILAEVHDFDNGKVQ